MAVGLVMLLLVVETSNAIAAEAESGRRKKRASRLAPMKLVVVRIEERKEGEKPGRVTGIAVVATDEVSVFVRPISIESAFTPHTKSIYLR